MSEKETLAELVELVERLHASRVGTGELLVFASDWDRLSDGILELVEERDNAGDQVDDLAAQVVRLTRERDLLIELIHTRDKALSAVTADWKRDRARLARENAEMRARLEDHNCFEHGLAHTPGQGSTCGRCEFLARIDAGNGVLTGFDEVTPYDPTILDKLGRGGKEE